MKKFFIFWLVLTVMAFFAFLSIGIALLAYNYIFWGSICVILALLYGVAEILGYSYYVYITLLLQENFRYPGIVTDEPVTKAEKQPLLIRINTVRITATKEPFIAKDNFIMNTDDSAPVKISYLGDDFIKWFLSKEEQPFIGSTLKYGKLTHSSSSDQILKELGSEGLAETTLTELFSLMKIQKNGKRGSLLTNGCANIFFIRDVTGILRAVFAYCRGSSWGVGARAVADSYGWSDDVRVFSRIFGFLF